MNQCYNCLVLFILYNSGWRNDRNDVYSIKTLDLTAFQKLDTVAVGFKTKKGKCGHNYQFCSENTVNIWACLILWQIGHAWVHLEENLKKSHLSQLELDETNWTIPYSNVSLFTLWRAAVSWMQKIDVFLLKQMAKTNLSEQTLRNLSHSTT